MATIKVLFVVALVALVSNAPRAVFAQSSAIQNMLSNTNFLQSKTNCNPDNNSYIAAIYNAFVTPTDAIFQLDCDGAISQTNPFTVQPLTTSLQYSVYPSAGGVGNRICQLSLLIRNSNLNNNAWTQTKTYSSTCGTVVANGATEDCGYANAVCMIQIGQCLGNFMCWLYFGYSWMILFGALLCGYIALAMKHRRAAKVVMASAPESKTANTRTSSRASFLSSGSSTSSTGGGKAGYYT